MASGGWRLAVFMMMSSSSASVSFLLWSYIFIILSLQVPHLVMDL
jgi:hypothetical protein